MLQAFLRFLGGEEGEETRMWLLLGLGFSMGVFLASYEVGASSLFIQTMGEAYLDKAFFVAGALGIISTAAFVYLQARIPFSILAIMNAFLILLFVAGLRASFFFFDYEVDGIIVWFPFILFVMMGPITSITLLNFWGIFGRLFDTKQAKRIIGGIDTGQLTATMIAFFSIPVITRLPIFNDTYDLLLVASLAAAGILYFVVYISFYWNMNKSTERGEGEEIEKVSYATVLKNPFTRLLTFFMIFSVGAAVFVDFTYYSTVEIYFTDLETQEVKTQELEDFLSFFSGTIIIMSFLIQSFINDIIIGRFGLKIALMTMPVILILFTVGSIITGHIFGYEAMTDGGEFLLFFMFAVSAKAFTFSLRDALEQPAFKLFFLPFNIKIRFDIQTRIEGVMNELATLLAGLAQMGLGLLVFFELIHYSYLILALAGMVIWLAAKLYSQYKVTLVNTLTEQKEKLAGSGKRNEHTAIHVLKSELDSEEESRVFNALKVFEIVDPLVFQFTLLDLLKHKFAAIRRFAYEKLAEVELFQALEIIRKELKSEDNPETLKAGELTITTLQEAAAYELNDESIRKLIRSTDPHERALGAHILAKLKDDKHLAFVLETLRDINPEVRIAAMETAGLLKRSEMWPVLVENLHLSSYSNAAVSALVHIGEPSLYTIDAAFYKTGQYSDTRFRAVQILGRTGGKKAIELLWKKVDYPDRRIVTEVLNSLSHIGFQAKDHQQARLQLVIEDLIGNITWNLKALEEIPSGNPMDKMIKEAIKEENKINYDNIFMLLSIIYDPQNVLLVKQNIELDTIDSVMFACEMLDVFISDELKPKLLPILDDLKSKERFEKLVNYYPLQEFEGYEDLLRHIINRDYNKITKFTKALAMYRMHNLQGVEVSNDIIANLFNPDRILRETAGYLMYCLDQTAYHFHVKRLKPSVKKELDKSILPPVFIQEGEDYHQQLLFIERILQLKNMEEFKDIPGNVITHLAEVLDEIRVSKETKLIERGDHGNVPIYIILKGSVEVTQEDGTVLALGKNAMLGEDKLLATETYEIEAVTTETTDLLVLRKEELFNQMSMHIEIIDTFIKVINHDYKKTKKETFDISIFN
ncbi:MAG: cyclic nucleotide-binding domain-containing protein [Cyclobacteriaceae bacterium]